MNEIKTEPLAAPTETPQAPQPTQPAKAKVPIEPSLPAKAPVSLKKWLLYAVAAYFGILLLALLAQIPRWIAEGHNRRVHTAVNTVTPESVIARCGPPVEDVTKDLYPMIARTMTYNSPLTAGKPGPGKVILFFSRTAEEKSDWVYSSMQDESRATTYSAPEEQIAALPCLASTK